MGYFDETTDKLTSRLADWGTPMSEPGFNPDSTALQLVRRAYRVLLYANNGDRPSARRDLDAVLSRAVGYEDGSHE